MGTRIINVVNTNYKLVSWYSLKDLEQALEDISKNGYKAIDIKFDLDGDIMILVSDFNGVEDEEYRA